MIAWRRLMAGLIVLFSPALVAASEPPPLEGPAVELDPAPTLFVTEPYPDPADALPPPNYPEPPPHVAERFVREGTIYDGFRTGELEYLRGYFPDATEEEREQYSGLKAWFKACDEEGTARLIAEMAQYGVTLLDGEFSGAASICQQVIFGNQGLLDRFATYEEFAKAARTARLVFDGLIEGIDIAEGDTAALYYRDILGEIDYYSLRISVLLRAQTWGQTKGYGDRRTFDPNRPPKMTPDERFVFGAFIQSEYVRLKFARTRWLEEIVGLYGWPTQANSTKSGAGNARLFVWYGDHDPAFQLRMLRVMEAQVPKGGLKGWEYAEAYDGVMLKLTGKQRYGTHWFCGDDGGALEKLEDPDKLNDWRKEMGLEPTGDYLAEILGQCGDPD